MEESHLSKQKKVTILDLVIGHVDIVRMAIEHGEVVIHPSHQHQINGPS